MAAMLVSSVLIGFGWSALAGFNTVTSFANFFARFLVIVALGLAVWRVPAGAPQVMWVFLLLSTVFDIVAAILWNIHLPATGLASGVSLTESNPIIVPAADALQLSSYGIMLLALWQLRSTTNGHVDWRVPGLDIAISILALSAIAWIVILKSAFVGNESVTFGSLLLELAYPVLDLTVLIALLLIRVNPPRAVAASLLRGLTYALIFYLLVDLLVGAAVYLSTALKPWLLKLSSVFLGSGLAAVGLTALYPHETARATEGESANPGARAPQITRWLSSLSVAGLFTIMLFISASDGPDADFLIVASMAIIGLLLVMRQVVAAAGIQVYLERQVGQRTEQLEQARVELEASNRSLQSLVDHAPLALAVRSRQGSLILTNPVWDQLVTNLPDLADWRPANQRDASFTQVTLRQEDGSNHYFLAGCADYLGEHGEQVGNWVIITDITSVKTRELQLQSMARMASLGEMATGLAHEINQPLGALRLGIANLERKLATEPFDLGYTQEKLNRMDEIIERINKLIVGMKTFGRVHDAELEVLDLGQSVQTVTDLLGEQLGLREVSLSVMPIEKPMLVRGATMKLEQVLINLLNNAADSITEVGAGGEIVISIEEQGNHLLLAVEDNGPGFPPDLMERLMEPFFTTKAPGKGTGLGLSYSQGIVTELGGSMRLENTSRGAKVILVLPKAN